MASRALYVNPDTGEVVAKNLNVSGTSTIVDTYTTVSSNISVMNLSGTGPALRVAQTGVGAGYPVADFYDNDVSTTVPALRIADGGNVGIGTDTPVQKLHVQGSVMATTQVLGPVADTVAAPGFSWSGDANTGMYHPGADKLGLVTAGVERVSVLANGNVGIGTTNPLGTLHVNGSLVTSASDGVVRKFSSYISIATSSTIKIGEFTFNGTSQNIHIKGVITGQSGAYGGVVEFEALCRSENSVTTKSFFIQQTIKNLPYSLTFRLWEDATSGRVVLGFTPSSSIQSYGWDLTIFERYNINLFVNQSTFVAVDTSGLTERYVSTSIATDVSGNVGIGTTTPTQKLHVQGNILSTGSTSVGTQFLGLAADTLATPSFSWTGDLDTGMYHPAADKLGLVTAGVERVSVLANGNVGIGTTAPTTKLDVFGTVQIKGELNVAASSISGENQNRTYVVGTPVGITIQARSGRSGSFHAFAVANDGKVYTWGYNYYGQLGNNSTTNSLIPVNVSTFGSLLGRTVVAISGGYGHTIALDNTGAVHGWGLGDSGMIGNNSTTNSLIPVNVSTFGSLSGRTVVAVACGDYHTVALDSTGAVHTWGYNGQGQLGRNNQTTSTIPVNVSTFGSLSGRTVVSINAGDRHNAALDSTGAVHTWGSNAFGQLGNNNSPGDSPIPVNVSTFGSLSGRTVVMVICGYSHTIALDSTGAVHTWGRNSNGQLGNNTTTNAAIPINVTTVGSLSGANVVAVAGGENHTVALDSTGAVHTWGYNLFGQLGNNSSTDSSIPVNVNTFGSLSGAFVVAVAGGAGHTIAFDNTGAVHTWGWNGYGQLGINNTNSVSRIPIKFMLILADTSLLGIGLIPSFQLHLSRDSAAKPSTSTWTVSSDERLKTDIEVADYDRCYEIVSKLDLKSYKWNSNIPQLLQSVGDDRHRLGWIAQEVEPIFPKAIFVVPELYGMSNILNANFDQLYAVQYGALKKLMDKVTFLEQENAQSKQDLVDLIARLK